MRLFTSKEIVDVMRKKGYSLFPNGSVNIIGIRNNSSTPNSFDDSLYVLRYLKSEWTALHYAVTTDPGSTTLIKPINNKGTAIVKPGQYPGMWAVGLHKGKYPALVQIGNCTVIRDNNRDNRLDFNSPIEETGDNFGINCHKAASGIISKFVNSYSAGCIVHADANRFDNEFMPLMKKDAKKYGNRFTFTLLEEKDFDV